MEVLRSIENLDRVRRQAREEFDVGLRGMLKFVEEFASVAVQVRRENEYLDEENVEENPNHDTARQAGCQLRKPSFNAIEHEWVLLDRSIKDCDNEGVSYYKTYTLLYLDPLSSFRSVEDGAGKRL